MLCRRGDPRDQPLERGARARRRIQRVEAAQQRDPDRARVEAVRVGGRDAVAERSSPVGSLAASVGPWSSALRRCAPARRSGSCKRCRPVPRGGRRRGRSPGSCPPDWGRSSASRCGGRRSSGPARTSAARSPARAALKRSDSSAPQPRAGMIRGASRPRREAAGARPQRQGRSCAARAAASTGVGPARCGHATGSPQHRAPAPRQAELVLRARRVVRRRRARPAGRR